MAKFKDDQESLLQSLRSLLSTSHNTDVVPFVKFKCSSTIGYVIHHVPPNIKHPLNDIVNHVKNNFLLVSKLPEETVQDRHNESYEYAEAEHDTSELELDLTLPIVMQQRVSVGTPIAQKIHHLSYQRVLHLPATEVSKSIDTSNLGKLEVKNARYFLSIYTQCMKLEKTGLPEIWLLCNQDACPDVAFMGMIPDTVSDAKKPSLKNHGGGCRPVSTVMVRCENLNHTIKKDHLVLADEKKAHMAFHRAVHALTHGYAKYHIYGTPDNPAGNDGGDHPESSITMEFAWDGVTKILQRPPPSGNAVLNVHAHPEDVRDILLGISKELNCLVNHFAVIQGEVSGTEDEEDEEIYDEDQVLKFLDSLKKNNFISTNVTKDSTTSVGESPAGGNIAAPFGIGEALLRQDLDNTEQLWLFLKDFTSENKILFCLKHIMSALFKGEYHPILHAGNQTQLAKLIKDVFCCKTDAEKAGVKAKINNAINSCSALQCLVDIGLQKLQNDYTNYFIQDLVTKDKLDYYLAQEIPTSEKIQRLLKLHCVLSLVALSIAYAHISDDGLRKLVSAALVFYEDHPYTEHPVFSLSLPAFSAASSGIKTVCIEKFQLQTWSVAITSMNEQITVIQVETDNHLQESFVDQENLSQSSHIVTKATVSQISI